MTTENSELLRRYWGDKSEAAFAELVRRNIDLVYSAAFRQVNGDHTLAQDVTQAVFTDLARKAPLLARHSSLTGWLYTSTRFLATKALRSEHRRRVREEKAHAMSVMLQDSDSDPSWKELRPVLDEIMHELSRPDREAVLLRFFEGRALGEIGARLGVSENAARMRVDRALDKLRDALARRGVTSTSAALGAVLAARTVAAAPAGLAARVTRGSLEAGSASGTLVWALLAWLGGIKAQLLIGGAVMACLVAGAALVHWTSPRAVAAKPALDVATPGRDLAASTAPELAAATNVIAPPAVATLADSSNRLVLKIVAADSGKPVPGVRVESWTWEGEQVRGRKPLQSTRFGICEVPVSRATVTKLVLVTQTDGFAETRVQWQPGRGESLPESYTVRLARAVRLGGRVLDAEGEPVEGATVGFNNTPSPALEGQGPQSDNFGWPFWVTATTDAQGRWTIDRIGQEATRTIYGGASHPEHVGSEFVWPDRDTRALKQLLDGSHVFRLGRAVVVRGTVVDPDGEPVANAKVRVGPLGESNSREGKTQANGTFAVSGCKPGENLLTAEAKGFAPATLGVKLTAEAPPYRLTLQRGRVLRLRVVNRTGEPVPKANVWLNTLDHGSRGQGDAKAPLIQAEFDQKTDPDGRVKWEGAPDQELRFDIVASGYMRADGVKARPDGQEHVITLLPALTISGTVKDAASGQPVPAFRIISGWPQWDPSNNTTNARWSTLDRFWLNFTGGKFRHVLEEAMMGGMPNPGFVFKFEAEGYAPFITRVVGPEETEVSFEVLLRAAAAEVVTVLGPDGRPAAGADIGLVSPGARLELIPGGLSRDHFQSGSSLLVSDQRGQFKLPAEEAITQLVVAHAQGFAELTRSDLATEPIVRLQPWGQLEGTYTAGGKAVAGREIYFEYGQGSLGSVSVASQAYRAMTDENGRFTFSQVPAGSHQLVRRIQEGSGPQKSWSHRPLAAVEIRPGETTQVTLGGASYTVTTRLRWPEELKRDPKWSVHLWLHTPLPKPPESAQGNAEALAAWRALPEVKAALSTMRHLPLTENADGTFSVEEVPAGEYSLSVSVLETPNRPGPAKTHARAEALTTIPSEPPSGTVDLGEVVLKAVP